MAHVLTLLLHLRQAVAPDGSGKYDASDDTAELEKVRPIAPRMSLHDAIKHKRPLPASPRTPHPCIPHHEPSPEILCEIKCRQPAVWYLCSNLKL